MSIPVPSVNGDPGDFVQYAPWSGVEPGMVPKRPSWPQWASLEGVMLVGKLRDGFGARLRLSKNTVPATLLVLVHGRVGHIDQLVTVLPVHFGDAETGGDLLMVRPGGDAPPEASSGGA